jgi:LmbE family N-acetylglucosaminyl deacetylase
MTTMFLFAHQDDEIGALHVIETRKRHGGRVLCTFLTNGEWAGVTSATRNAESRKVLNALGVATDEIEYLGTDLAIPDGALVERLDVCFAGLCALVDRSHAEAMAIESIVMHAWEGGHQDHDAGHLLGIALAQRYGLIAQSRQFPLYRKADDHQAMTFSDPLDSNGPPEKTAIPLLTRLRFLRLLLTYRSQARVILRLLPHILKNYALKGEQCLQPLSIARLRAAPNAPPMLYETWKLYSYERFRTYVAPFLIRNFPDLALHSEAHKEPL